MQCDCGVQTDHCKIQTNFLEAKNGPFVLLPDFIHFEQAGVKCDHNRVCTYQNNGLFIPGGFETNSSKEISHPLQFALFLF